MQIFSSRKKNDSIFIFVCLYDSNWCGLVLHALYFIVCSRKTQIRLVSGKRLAMRVFVCIYISFDLWLTVSANPIAVPIR